MGRLAWSQLRFAAVRLIALLAGMLLATTAFTVLTAASRTSQLRTVGTVSEHFLPAYEILVRPEGARTALETQAGTVQPNFLSGIYGGITMAQDHEIGNIPGVQVAAPIAMAGYALLDVPVSLPFPAAHYDEPGRQLYRITSTWVSDGGSSSVTQPASYLYVTPDRLRLELSAGGNTVEIIPGHSSAPVCPSINVAPAADPFGIAAQSATSCWSKIDGTGLDVPQSDIVGAGGNGIFTADWALPVLIAAVDPVAEARLDGLNHAVISGTYLTEHAGDGRPRAGAVSFPVLAASASGTDEYALTRLQSLPPPSAPPAMTLRWLENETTTPGQTIVTDRTTAHQAYQQLLRDMSVTTAAESPVWGYWSAGPVTYRGGAASGLTPLTVRNPLSVYYTGGVGRMPMDNEDNQYRKVAVHGPGASITARHVGGNRGLIASARLVGIFNQARVKSFDPLSEVPLGAYQPVVAAPANAASRKALSGSDLLPNQNLGGYVSQPADLITTLSALPALQSGYYGADLPVRDPISVIRVRVAGVTGPDALSLERIREMAQQIEFRTHLDVDIVAGSSPAPAAIQLPAGKFGRPALALTEDWVKKGVALAILTAVDKNSLVLFVLILIVCVLFVANSASAAIRGRRRELGVLACLGWTRPRLFTAVLGELAAIGLAAGIGGAAAALPLSSVLGLHASPGRAALAVPVAVGVAVASGVGPAWRAARAEPVASVRPPVLGVRRARQPGGVTALAVVNVLRTPGRALAGAVSLAVGITALTVLAALTFAFRGVLVGSLLGDAVAVQVRGVDYVAVAATITLGVLAVSDVVFLNITERAAELATFRALGWCESTLSRLVITEGVVIGLAGSLAGAALGIAFAGKLAGELPARLYLIAGVAVAAGVLVTATAALLPAQELRRLPAARLLAQE